MIMSDFIFSIVVLFIFLFICLLGIKKQNGLPNNTLDKFNSIRGIFALNILLGHVVQYENSLAQILSKFMIASVGFFFFVSAFSMSSSFKKNPHYISCHFLLRKCGFLLFMAFNTYLISCLLNVFFHVYIWNFYGLSDLILGFGDRTNWYVWILLLFYLLFYFTYKYIHRYRVAIFFVITFISITILYLCKSQEMYYASSLCFPLGLMFGEYHEAMSNYLNSAKGVMTTILLFILGILSLIFSGNIVGACYLKNVFCISVILTLSQVFNFFTLENPIISFLTKYSAETYFFHFFWVYVTLDKNVHYYYRMPIVLLCTILISIPMNIVNTFFKQYINSKLIK